MFLRHLQKLQSQGMGPMGGGGSSGSSGGGGMSGANGRDGGTTGSSGGISGQGNIGNNNFGESSGGGGGGSSPSSSFNANAFGSLASANKASGTGLVANVGGSNVSDGNDSRRSSSYSPSTQADRRGLTTRDGVSQAVGDMAQNGWRGSLAGFAAGTLAAPAGPIGSVLASAGAKAAVGTQAQRASEARVTGAAETDWGSGMANRAVPSLGGTLGGQGGSFLGGQIGADLGGLPGAVVGTIGGGILGSVMGTNMATGIMNGEGVNTGFGATSGSAGSEFTGSITNTLGNLSKQAQPTNQPQGNAYGWQGYNSSFGNYGSHNSQFVGNPNRARAALK